MDITELKRTRDPLRIRRHPWEIARADLIGFLLKKYRPGIKRILDFGSGDAFLLNHLATKSYASRYDAVDTGYSDDLVATLTENTHPEIEFHKSTSHLQTRQEKSDCCLLLDVLEHCPDDVSVLRSVVSGELTTSDAAFIITVPAYQSLYSSHDRLLHHYRRYNRKQITRVCKESGLDIIHSGYFFSALIPVRLFQLFLEKMKIRKATHSLDGWKGGKHISRLFYAILWTDFKLGYLLSRAGIKIPGLSAYCICRKQLS